MNNELKQKLKDRGEDELYSIYQAITTVEKAFYLLAERYAEKYLQAVEYLEMANVLSPVDITLIKESFGHGKPFNNVAEFCRLFPKWLPYEISNLKTRKSKMKTTKVRELLRILNDAKSN